MASAITFRNNLQLTSFSKDVPGLLFGFFGGVILYEYKVSFNSNMTQRSTRLTRQHAFVTSKDTLVVSGQILPVGVTSPS